jgi:predicted glycoside hydrolase/deacetylase ChbG (UPF0249 family)
MKKLLIINADDLGYSVGINRGIVYCSLKGVVTSTSLIAGGEYATHGVDYLMEQAPKLEIGLHITLTGLCSPISSGKSLINENGNFFSYQEWLNSYHNLNEQDIEEEIFAQWNKFLSLVGHLPSHVDSHHYICFKHPAALRTLIQLTNKYNIPVRYRGDIENQLDIPIDKREELITLIKNSNLQYPNLCVKSFQGEKATIAHFISVLQNLDVASISEICCHPGFIDAELKGSYTHYRQIELKVLTDTSVKNYIRDNNISLTNYRNVFLN